MLRALSGTALGRSLVSSLCLAAGCTWSAAAWSQGPSEAVVTQILPLTGAVAQDALGVSAGVQVGIAATNARGGIKGTRIKLTISDDKYQAPETERLFREAAAGEAIAAFVPVGSASMVPLLSKGVVDSLRLPIIGVVPGAEPLRKPGSPWLFHVRASDDQQMAKIVEHSWTVGQRRIGVLYADIPFGKAGLAAAKKSLAGLQQEPTLALPFSMQKTLGDLDASLEKMKSASLESVILIAPATQAGMIAKWLRDKGFFLPVYALSYADVGTLCKVAGPQVAHGVGIAQVVPNYSSRSLGIATDFQRDWARHAPKDATPSQYAFEGYIAWRTFEEAMARSGGPWTREGVRRSLERLGTVSLGGYRVEYSPQDRGGSNFVDIAVVGLAGDRCVLRY